MHFGLAHVAPPRIMSSLRHLGVSVLDDAQLDAISLGQGNPRLRSFTNREHVLQARGERMADGILDVHDLKGSWVLLPVSNASHTPDVVSARDHGRVSTLELHPIQDLASCDINADGVVDLDGGVRVTQSAAVMGDRVRDAL